MLRAWGGLPLVEGAHNLSRYLTIHWGELRSGYYPEYVVRLLTPRPASGSLRPYFGKAAKRV